MFKYKGYKYFCDDGIWKVILKSGGVIVVALDDSKTSGRRKWIEKLNTGEACRALIDMLAA